MLSKIILAVCLIIVLVFLNETTNARLYALILSNASCDFLKYYAIVLIGGYVPFLIAKLILKLLGFRSDGIRPSSIADYLQRRLILSDEWIQTLEHEGKYELRNTRRNLLMVIGYGCTITSIVIPRYMPKDSCPTANCSTTPLCSESSCYVF